MTDFIELIFVPFLILIMGIIIFGPFMAKLGRWIGGGYNTQVHHGDTYGENSITKDKILKPYKWMKS